VSVEEPRENLPLPMLTPDAPAYNHPMGCDCQACQAHYLLPHRASGNSIFFRPDGYWNTVAKPKLQYSHWGYCDQFCERPFGVAVTGHFQRQVINGLGQQMMLYEYDFLDVDADELNSRGRYQLEKIAQRYQHGIGPIQIASSEDNPRLDVARRQAVARELHRLGMTVGPDQVFTRRQPRTTINPHETLLILRNREQGVMTRGVGGLSGAASGTTNTNAGS
jgi:hypothetical protein